MRLSWAEERGVRKVLAGLRAQRDRLVEQRDNLRADIELDEQIIAALDEAAAAMRAA